ncbi:hypothetical protein TcWFU_001429 [Taenia crassiceps]|uniref:TRPM-like domain-containing protein n=1 Tax=Taenia crassiceps TaxID=6207 RepID=A0ABR4Q567_9CEST
MLLPRAQDLHKSAEFVRLSNDDDPANVSRRKLVSLLPTEAYYSKYSIAADILDRALRFWSSKKSSKGFPPSQVAELQEMLAVLLGDDKANQRDAKWTVDHGIELLETIMQVALKFGRIDVVKEKILPDGAGRLRSSSKRYQLNRLMTAALLDDRREFAEYLMEQELVEMSTYLDVITLTCLYNGIEDASSMQRCLTRFNVRVEESQPGLMHAALLATTASIFAIETETSGAANTMLEMLIHRKQEKAEGDLINLHTVKRLLRKLLGSFTHPLYQAVTPFNRRVLFPNPLQARLRSIRPCN